MKDDEKSLPDNILVDEL